MSTNDAAVKCHSAACPGPDEVSVTWPVCNVPAVSRATDESGLVSGCRSANDAAVPDQIAACSLKPKVAPPTCLIPSLSITREATGPAGCISTKLAAEPVQRTA